MTLLSVVAMCLRDGRRNTTANQRIFTNIKPTTAPWPEMLSLAE